MTKRITISIPDELNEKLQKAKKAYPDIFPKISKICQKALAEEAERYEAFNLYTIEGINDGKKSFKKISSNIIEKIANVINEKNPRFAGTTLLEKSNYLIDSYEKDITQLEKAFDFHEGNLSLCDWVNFDSGLSSEDKKSEVAWCYREGIFLGICEEYQKGNSD